MARFGTTPPTDPLPRAEMDLPDQASRPDDFSLPDVTAGLPEGLPSIPVVERPDHFPDPFPDGADEPLEHFPWL